jgi:hypothetical protein
MKTEKIRIINPQNGVKWKECLNLLKEEQPGALRILMETESLINFLDSCVAHIVVYRHVLINNGAERGDAERKIIYRLLPHEIVGVGGGYIEEDLKELLDSIEEREVEIEV